MCLRLRPISPLFRYICTSRTHARTGFEDSYLKGDVLAGHGLLVEFKFSCMDVNRSLRTRDEVDRTFSPVSSSPSEQVLLARAKP